MDKVKKKIQKSAKRLYFMCRIMQIVMLFSCIFAAAGILAALIGHEELMLQFQEIFIQEGLLDLWNRFPFFHDDNLKYILIFAGMIHMLTRSILIIYLQIFSKILKRISEGAQPFTKKNASTIFVVSLSVLVFGLYNPLTAITLCMVGLFFSQLIKYGTFLQERAEETNRIQESMIVSFAEVVENKSEQTGQHVKRVAEYSGIIAAKMGLPDEAVENLRLASMMHDIGKLMIPTEILEKPARLTDEEYAEIKKHSGYGGKLLNSVEGDVMELAKNIALEHHERVDGHGYPNGKNGKEILLESKIVAVADVYDALTSKRSYKEPWDEKKAYEEILKGSGTQFDEKVVDAFKSAYPQINQVRQQFAD